MSLLHTIEEDKPENLSNSELEFFPNNFNYVQDLIAEITAMINDQFYLSLATIENVIKYLMITLFLLLFFIKIYEYLRFKQYLLRLTKAVNIFMRINTNEIMTEIRFCKDALNLLKDPAESYLIMNCIDLVNSQKIDFNAQNEVFSVKKSNKKSSSQIKIEAKKKAKQKPSMIRFEGFKTIFFFIYSIFFVLLIFGVIFFNFEYFFQTCSKITQVIDFSIFFKKVYSAPSSAMVLNRVCMREKIIEQNTIFILNKSFAHEKEIFDDMQGHLKVMDEIIRLLPKHTATNSAENIYIKTIIFGSEKSNICQELYSNDLITINDKELCLTILDRSFTVNLFSVLKSIQTSLIQENDLIKPIDLNNIAEREKQKEEIKKVLISPGGLDRIYGYYFLHKTLDYLNNILGKWYEDQMLLYVNNLERINLAISLVMIFILLIAFFIVLNYLVKIYKAVMFAFDLIPFEKIINDEQTNFLIKQYYKE